MDADQSPIVAAPGDLNDGELVVLLEATNAVPQIAPGLLAWIEGTADWELNRRWGLDYTLPPPEAAMTPEDASVSIDAAVIIKAQFAQDPRPL